MVKPLGFLLAPAVLAALGFVPGASARVTLERAPSPSPATAKAVPGEMIVRYDPGTTSAEKREIRADQGATLDGALALPRTEVVELPAGTSLEEAAAAFEDDPDVAFAEPNYVREIASTPPPNDPLYCPPVPGDCSNGQWDLPKISAPSAWELTTGSSSVVVAVIDTGVAYDHEDLAANLWTNNDPANGVDDDENGKVDDTHGWDFVQDDKAALDFAGHGTHVAGTIGAKGHNGVGIAGVDWDVSLMPVRAGDFEGAFANSDIVDAMTYACNEGADIVNESFTGTGFSVAEQAALTSSACAQTLFVVAAGNEAKDVDVASNARYPCDYSAANLICVANSRTNDTLYPTSNFGATSVDIAAPGEDILSTLPDWSLVAMEDFEEMEPEFLNRWGNPAGAGVPWGRPGGMNRFLSDSPGVPYTSTSSIGTRLTTSLGGKSGCAVRYDIRGALGVGDAFVMRGGTASNAETVEVSRITSATSLFNRVEGDLSGFDGGPLSLRLSLDSNGDGLVADGVDVDNISYWCLDGAPSAEYVVGDGTSFSAPHVAGVAALVLAYHPEYTTVQQLRSAVLQGVDAIPAFAGKVVFGGRLNARKALDAVPQAIPPAPTSSSGPAGLVASAAASVSFSDTDATARFECRRDGAAFAPCASPTTYSGLAQGAHTFDVRALNSAGTSSAHSIAWTVDTFPPTKPVLQATGKQVAWTSSDLHEPLTYDVFVDGAKVATTTGTSRTVSVSCGHSSTIGVEAIDAAGNRSLRGTVVVTGGTCVPQTTISSGPGRTTTSRTAAFRFRSSLSHSTFQCRLDSGAWRTCRSPKTYKSLKKGRHTFRVRAIGPGGVKDTTPAARSWRIR